MIAIIALVLDACLRGLLLLADPAKRVSDLAHVFDPCQLLEHKRELLGHWGSAILRRQAGGRSLL
jgi:hypothetical protein